MFDFTTYVKLTLSSMAPPTTASDAEASSNVLVAAIRDANRGVQ